MSPGFVGEMSVRSCLSKKKASSATRLGVAGIPSADSLPLARDHWRRRGKRSTTVRAVTTAHLARQLFPFSTSHRPCAFYGAKASTVVMLSGGESLGKPQAPSPFPTRNAAAIAELPPNRRLDLRSTETCQVLAWMHRVHLNPNASSSQQTAAATAGWACGVAGIPNPNRSR